MEWFFSLYILPCKEFQYLVGVKYLTDFFLLENSLATISPQKHLVFLQIHFGIWRNTYFDFRNSLWSWAERHSSSVKLSPSSTLSPTISTQTSSPPKLQSRKVRGTQLVSMVNFHKNIFSTLHFYRTQVWSLACLVSKSLTPFSCWILLKLDLFKFLHGFL